MGAFRYYTNCVGIGDDELPLLEQMMTDSEEITYEQFMKLTDQRSVQEVFDGYEWEEGRGILRLEDDYHVRYHKSKFGDNPCVYVVHSAIEYVFI